jgi:predicted DNA-binding antitoxin AbrB/MazE fold protein
MSKKRKKLKGTVQKIIKPVHSTEAEKAQIDLHDAEHLYREIRVENIVIDEEGQKASLKPGAEVDVVIEADSDATVNKPD